MKFGHIPIWVTDLEIMHAFYEIYFMAVSGNIYVNSNKYFSTYFQFYTRFKAKINSYACNEYSFQCYDNI